LPARDPFAAFASPAAVQEFLDGVAYSAEPVYRCPASVLRDRKAHCFDGAVFAAAALRRLGERPLIFELLTVPGRDDTHVIALYRRGGAWGAVAKSNFAGLRFREAVHRSLRELALTYFDLFYNPARERTLRGYTVPLDLSGLDRLRWEEDDVAMDVIAERLDRLRRFTLITPAMAAALSPLDERSYQAGMVGTDPAGVFKLPED
jgi:hypothetical protein